MKLQMASIGFLLVCGAWNAQSSMAAPTGPQSDTLAMGTEGAMYEHSLEKSRFDVGAGAHTENQGPYERIVGDRGVFLFGNRRDSSSPERTATN